MILYVYLSQYTGFFYGRNESLFKLISGDRMSLLYFISNDYFFILHHQFVKPCLILLFDKSI
jgi:hypothetical protein